MRNVEPPINAASEPLHHIAFHSGLHPLDETEKKVYRGIKKKE